MLRCLPLGLLLVFLGTVIAADEPPRVLPKGQLPNDARLKPLKDYDGYFPFTVPANVDDWKARREVVIRRILVSQGLWPLPTKTPLNPVIHGRVERDGYTVERVFFESMPGFFVTGSLYRPVGKTGKAPVVLCPHGHWNNGRFHDAGRGNVRKEIVNGAERFEEGGRSPLQARCVQLARMGCVVFHYDMIGYADSTQLSFELVHRYGTIRPEMNTAENWGLFSTQAEANLQSVMGLQTWNSIRALDFVLALPDADAERVAVTGASGGGTQTMLLAAIDPRITVAFPAVMVSTAMQGGCTCENASLLRVDTGNIEFAALFAPGPQGMTAANDWTKEMATKGFPELKQVYALLGKPENVALHNFVHFGHNYNYVSRSSMYQLINKQFKLGLEEPVVEEDYKRLSQDEMTVWNDKHPKPAGGDDFERKLCKYWREDAQQQLDAAANDPAKLRAIVGPAVETLIGRGLPSAKDITYDQSIKEEKGTWILMAGLMKRAKTGEETPLVFLYPKQWNKQVVLWLHEDGKAGLFQPDGAPQAEVKKLLDGGATVVGIDLMSQGEFLADGQPLKETPKVPNKREFAGYTFGFNHSVFAQRVHDVLAAIVFVKNHDLKPQRVDLIGLGPVAGPLALAARSQAKDQITSAAIDTAGFRFSGLLDYRDPKFLPGGAKYWDVPGLVALAAPEKTWLASEKDAALAAAAYAAAGKKDALATFRGEDSARIAAAVAYLLAP